MTAAPRTRYSSFLGYPRLPSVPYGALRHIPGTGRGLIVGDALAFVADPLKFVRDRHAAFGPISRTYFPFEAGVVLLSADGNEFVLRDRAQNFSAHLGWEPLLGRLFRRGLMLRDGDDHRLQRRLMQPAFRKEALAGYLERMTPRIVRETARWGQRPGFRFYPAIKRLTLDIAADVFLGLELQSEVDQVNRDFATVVEASLALVRVPVLGRKYARGLEARSRLERFLAARIPERRNGNGSDLFSQMCRTVSESGERYSDEEIVDHLIFLMMAAHDTTTSALTTIAYALARQPQWQERLRETVQELDRLEVQPDDLSRLEPVEWVLHEALRLYPPLPAIARRTVRDCEIHGFSIPANVAVSVYPIFTHHDPQWWTEPERFDPERFSPARGEDRRHGFAWVPFGGGAHMCLGMHFAEMQVKAVLVPLLRQWRLGIPADYRVPYQLAPIAKPRDGLPMSLQAV
ncbi:MAG: cytochrome P450 [Nevskia sp.]|nr:cytochrome P450 [Nevskia sp.]